MEPKDDYIPDVFVFCWYPDGWLPRAIIADISKLDDEARRQMQLILNIKDNIIQRTYERTKVKNIIERTCERIKGANNNVVVDDNGTIIAINTWEQLSDSIHSFEYMSRDDLNHWIHFTYEYYINDINSNLSPVNLHNVLSLMTCHPKDDDIRFNVKHCVLLSDIPIIDSDDSEDFHHVKQLRFFYKTTTPVTEDEVVDMLKIALGVDEVIIADSGYGYITPKDITQWSELNGKKFRIGDITCIFD